MLKNAVRFVLIVLWPVWQLTAGIAAHTGTVWSQASAPQPQTSVNTAERDEALADIKKMIAGREDEPAEKVFKNIEILKGKKASRLPGMMGALTGLLGVNCSYCHVKDKWDSDEKQAKQTARKMFRMIGTINSDFFGGQNKVSCWTCHRGNPHPPISG